MNRHGMSKAGYGSAMLIGENEVEFSRNKSELSNSIWNDSHFLVGTDNNANGCLWNLCTKGIIFPYYFIS